MTRALSQAGVLRKRDGKTVDSVVKFTQKLNSSFSHAFLNGRIAQAVPQVPENSLQDGQWVNQVCGRTKESVGLSAGHFGLLGLPACLGQFTACRIITNRHMASIDTKNL